MNLTITTPENWNYECEYSFLQWHYKVMTYKPNQFKTKTL